MLKVVLPISVSGILTVVVFAFTLSMHEFIYALTVITSYSIHYTKLYESR